MTNKTTQNKRQQQATLSRDAYNNSLGSEPMHSRQAHSGPANAQLVRAETENAQRIGVRHPALNLPNQGAPGRQHKSPVSSGALRDNDPRKGEEQPRALLFLFLALALAAIVGIIVFVVILASTNASKTVLADEQERSIYNPSIVKAHFSILSVRYVDMENASCGLGTEFLRPVTLTVRFKSSLVPDSCSFFVNGGLITTERRLGPDCGTTCAVSEYNRQFSLKQNDYRDDQIIRVCCEDICVERRLDKLCT